jgi:poly-gamma-glutamate capsule biosynthesis protein CapA/YwtB (metallophosphatase superfamily)
MTPITLFLCGDVMLGRGIDQILPHPCDPAIQEPYMDSALGYVRLAERVNGPIARPVTPSYVWGDALEELARVKPHARIVNLETAVTCSEDRIPKGINYRMSPANVACLSAAAIDCCALANNHVLDWGPSGLAETLDTLRAAGIRTAGAGRSRPEAQAPAELALESHGRILVFSFGTEGSGVPPDWAAAPNRPGIDFLPDLSDHTADRIAARVHAVKRDGDLVVASVHWGGNWGYAISAAEERFAHRLIENAGVDVFHGHSSHHPKGIDVFRDKLILYGCGDFIDDYEGIGGHEEFRGDLGLMYFPTLEAETGRLLRLEVVPTQMKRLRAQRASPADAHWLRTLLDREGGRFGTSTTPGASQGIELKWKKLSDSRVPSP